MKRILTLTLLATLFLGGQSAWAETIEFSSDKPLETDYYKIRFYDTFTNNERAQTKIEVTNKTSDVMIIDMSKTYFVGHFGELPNFKDKVMKIDPHDSESMTLRAEGGGIDFRAYKFSVRFDGISLIKTNGAPQDGKDFKFPQEKNSMMVGTADCNVDKVVKKTDQFLVQFRITNTGTMPLVIDPSRTATRFANGLIVANANSKNKTHVLMPGENRKIIHRCNQQKQQPDDMQFIDLFVMWNDAIQETSNSELGGATMTFEKTDAKSLKKAAKLEKKRKKGKK